MAVKAFLWDSGNSEYVFTTVVENEQAEAPEENTPDQGEAKDFTINTIKSHDFQVTGTGTHGSIVSVFNASTGQILNQKAIDGLGNFSISIPTRVGLTLAINSFSWNDMTGTDYQFVEIAE